MTAQAVDKSSAAAPSHRRRSSKKLPSKQLLGLAGILGFLLVWELVPRVGIVEPRFLPPASEVIAALVRDFGLTAFWVAVGETMLAWLIGLVMAIVLATVLGFIIGSSSFLRKFTNSTVEFLRPIPSVALIPLAVLLFGVKIESTLMLVVYASFWQVFIQVLYGVADVDNVAMNTAKSYGLGRLARIRHVVFPTALPYLMTGVRLAASVALILAITAELVIGSPGLGREIALAQSGGAISGMYALVLATGLIGVVINLVMRWIERKTLSWHSSIRSEVIV
ncbi:binding-protein-dependent transport system inner membrane protein [Arthrobacter crystallopoietes BAB-32]|uniref:Binding-protein-dependent transport system inner membrane protein n=1 Tax=Arthrobacter crystallopoietes BAB-32 TaxID=1246476 RepID=N1V5K3_9MICC|nr:binding-protein-dependent transport system inner membrane protein [Arthrobacter crystallopoietes BAB-32]